MGSVYRLADRRCNQKKRQTEPRPEPQESAVTVLMDEMGGQLGRLEQMLESLLWQRNPRAAFNLRRN